MKFEILMKPTNLAKKAHRICPEYLVEVEATDKAQALTEARKCAERDNMRGYAITKVTAVTH